MGGFLAIILVGFGIVVLMKGIYVVQQSQCMIVERLGSYSHTMSGGLNFLIPFVDSPRSTIWLTNTGIRNITRLDLRESVLDVPEQAVITKDNVSISIDALMYIQVVDPVRATYEIANLP